MVMLLGMGAPGLINIADACRLEEAGVLHGSFKCGKCGRYYCWDHSNADQTCQCGEQNWLERQYLDPGFEQRLGGIAPGVPAQGSGTPYSPLARIKYPGLVLAAGLLFYAISAIGLLTGGISPNPEAKTLWYVMSLLPALAILFAGLRLRLSAIVAGLLALAGPAVLTWAFWCW
jgi:hypothetical protein